MADTLSDIPPVLIVGAGPTGLAAAMSLARAHVPVRIIDRLVSSRPRRFRVRSASRRARSNCWSSIARSSRFSRSVIARMRPSCMPTAA